MIELSTRTHRNSMQTDVTWYTMYTKSILLSAEGKNVSSVHICSSLGFGSHKGVKLREIKVKWWLSKWSPGLTDPVGCLHRHRRHRICLYLKFENVCQLNALLSGQ